MVLLESGHHLPGKLMLSHHHHHPASPPANCQTLGFQEGMCSVMLFTHGGVNNHQQPHERAFCFRELEHPQERPGRTSQLPSSQPPGQVVFWKKSSYLQPWHSIAHTCSNFVELEKIPINRHLSVYKSAFHHCDKICEIINFKIRKVYWFLVIWPATLGLQQHSQS